MLGSPTVPESKVTPRSRLLARIGAELTGSKSGQNPRLEAVRSSSTHLGTDVATVGQGCVVCRCSAPPSGALHRALLGVNVVGLGDCSHGTSDGADAARQRGYLIRWWTRPG
jgi:hypothetical protein